MKMHHSCPLHNKNPFEPCRTKTRVNPLSAFLGKLVTLSVLVAGKRLMRFFVFMISYSLYHLQKEL